MTQQILIILACVPLYVLNAFCDKYVSALRENKHNILYNGVKFLICTILLLPFFLMENVPKFRFGALFCGITCGLMYAVSKTMMLRGYEKTSVVFMTLCHSSGMIVPCIIGHFFWNERLTPLSVCGILAVIVSFVLLKSGNAEKNATERHGILIGLAVFLTSGGVMIAQKLMGLYFAEESICAYNLYAFAVTALILSCFIRPSNIDRTALRSITLPSLGSAVSLVVISVVMTKLASDVPSAILFPLFNGLGIIVVSIGSIPVFREKLTKKGLRIASGHSRIVRCKFIN